MLRSVAQHSGAGEERRVPMANLREENQLHCGVAPFRQERSTTAEPHQSPLKDAYLPVD